MYNWNKVYLRYCDGGSFAGNNETVSEVKGKPIYFRGYRNLVSYVGSLTQDHGFGSATEVVISGCSAGGLATYLHIDWWASHVKTGTKVRGLPDSGFFLDYDSTEPKGPKYGRDMRWVFNQMNASDGVNQECIRLNPGAKENCFFAEHTAPHIKTPFFPLQSEYDSWQEGNILGTSNATELNAFGAELTKRFGKAVTVSSDNGAFLDSCNHHCGEWNVIVILGKDTSAAFDQWYTTGRGVFIQGKEFPCTVCCHGGGNAEVDDGNIFFENQ